MRRGLDTLNKYRSNGGHSGVTAGVWQAIQKGDFGVKGGGGGGHRDFEVSINEGCAGVNTPGFVNKAGGGGGGLA